MRRVIDDNGVRRTRPWCECVSLNIFTFRSYRAQNVLGRALVSKTTETMQRDLNGRRNEAHADS